jgi:ribonuclease-3
VVSALYERFPELDEGQLSRIRADAVSRRACARVARELGLGDRVQAEGQDWLRANERVLAAILESTLGALYLAHGVEAIRVPIADAFMAAVEESIEVGPDPKTKLQEQTATTGSTVRYATTAEGPPHNPTFTATALVDDTAIGTGVGRSKKEAEQGAARQALEALAGEAPS